MNGKENTEKKEKTNTLRINTAHLSFPFLM